MEILLGGDQDIGKRNDQQDAFYISTPTLGHTEQTDWNLLVVCDGIGGASFGKEAAQITCETFKSSFMTKDKICDVQEALFQATRYSNTEVIAFMRRKGFRTVGGSTLIAAVIKNNMLYWISVPQRDSITNFIGIWELKEISSGKTRLSPGTSVVLCTDGLYKTLSEDEIVEVYDPDPQKWAKRLILNTIQKNTEDQDNVTVAITTAKD